MKIVIVGGVAGGASAATRCRRLSEDAEIIVFERGRYISFANCGLPYYIGEKIQKRKKLFRSSPGLFMDRYNIKVHTLSEVVSINRKIKYVSVINHKDTSEYNEPYDKLILSPGARPVIPPIPGINTEGIFTLRTIGDMDAIKTATDGNKGKKAIIIGGGFIGLELAENIAEKGCTVTIVEMLDQVMNTIDKEMAALIHNHLKEHNITLYLHNGVTSFKKKDSGIETRLADNTRLYGDVVIVAAGVIPESTLAVEAGLAIGIKKAIKVNEFMQTTDPDIYAIGDVAEATQPVNTSAVHIPLAGPAVRQARTAADHIFGRNSSFRGIQGTSVCKVFDLTVSSTGLNEKNVKKTNQPYEKVYIYDPQHVGYYPGATPILLKLIFNSESGKILGAQAIGKDGADKRIDSLSIAIQAHMSVFDLEESEFTYAPPYGAPKDIINMAGFAASNSIRGDVKVMHWDAFFESKEDDALLLDVRSPFEFGMGHVDGAINIHVNGLRQHIDRIEKYRDKNIYVYCLTGYRSYIACRILTQLKFNATNISGGYTLYKCFFPEEKKEK